MENCGVPFAFVLETLKKLKQCFYHLWFSCINLKSCTDTKINRSMCRNVIVFSHAKLCLHAGIDNCLRLLPTYRISPTLRGWRVCSLSHPLQVTLLHAFTYHLILISVYSWFVLYLPSRLWIWCIVRITLLCTMRFTLFDDAALSMFRILANQLITWKYETNICHFLPFLHRSFVK